jgi:hypothetical protein
LHPDYFSLKCEYCVEWGACIQCDNSRCSKSFHVRCAINNGLIRGFEEMEYSKNDENLVYVYCENHTKSMIGKLVMEEKKKI